MSSGDEHSPVEYHTNSPIGETDEGSKFGEALELELNALLAKIKEGMDPQDVVEAVKELFGRMADKLYPQKDVDDEHIMDVPEGIKDEDPNKAPDLPTPMRKAFIKSELIAFTAILLGYIGWTISSLLAWGRVTYPWMALAFFVIGAVAVVALLDWAKWGYMQRSIKWLSVLIKLKRGKSEVT